MSKKQWMVLLMVFLIYLLLGASIFYHIESRLEMEHVKRAKQERIEINALLQKHYVSSLKHNQTEIFERLTQYCGKSVYDYSENETEYLKWDFYNSFYFAYTVVSTIGYGNLSPTNMLSRILMIFYGLVGIPMNGILLTQLGEFFGNVFVKAHQKYKSYKQQQNDYYSKKLTPLETRKAGLAAQIFMYLTPGFVMFIFFPAFLFSHYEGWTYDESVYYAFVTLTTIGFGDYVAGQDNRKGSGFLFVLYKTFLVVWVSFGLGYIVMIMTFIAQGMRSKKIIRIEHKLAMNLKHTQSKIWNEFNKEINYLRRVFNELQLSKVKRVYVDECEYETPPTKYSRSNSFPDLRKLACGGLEVTPPLHPRRRANSEVVPMDELTRVVSETDLQRIDKTATFATHAMMQPADLLARLVNILGYIPPADDPSDWERDPETKEEEETLAVNGVDGFNEKEILAGENTWGGSTWKIDGEKIPAFSMPRSRAVSEVRLHETKNESNKDHSGWTWSGPTASKKLQELVKVRRTGLSNIENSKSYKFPSITLPKSVPRRLFPMWRKQSTIKSVSETEQNSKKSFNVPGESETSGDYLSFTAQPGLSSLDERNNANSKQPYFTHTGGNPESTNLLEETSIADFLRALTILHARVGAVPTEYARKPQRKLGTACLTPPKLPSLFTLFSPQPPDQVSGQSNQNTITSQGSYTNRRFSLRPTDNNSGSSTPLHYRRGSLAPAAKPRRFSLRPVNTPSGTPPEYNTSYLTNLRLRANENQTSQASRPTDSYVFDSPTKPLMQMEGAPGVSTPVTTASNGRRFSLRPAQIGVPPAPAGSNKTQTPKALPRWKAGMLQRQIGRMSIHRRVRAFSLSDVQTDVEATTDKSQRAAGVSPLAIDPNCRTITTVAPSGRPSVSSVQKTVTIVPPTKYDESFQGRSNETSPAFDPQSVSEVEEQQSRSCLDKFSDGTTVAINPFVQKLGRDVGDKSSLLSSSRYYKNGALDLSTHEAFIQLDGVTTDSSESEREGQEDVPLAARELDRGNNRSQDEFNNSESYSCDVTIGGTMKNLMDQDEYNNFKAEDKEIADAGVRGEQVYRPSEDTFSESSDSVVKSSLDKPRISIDSYRPLSDIKIEKPAMNPFLQYRATTSVSPYEDTSLMEVKVEKSNEMSSSRKLSAESRKPWETE